MAPRLLPDFFDFFQIFFGWHKCDDWPFKKFEGNMASSSVRINFTFSPETNSENGLARSFRLAIMAAVRRLTVFFFVRLLSNFLRVSYEYSRACSVLSKKIRLQT